MEKGGTETEIRTWALYTEQSDTGQEVLNKLTIEMMENKYLPQSWLRYLQML